MAVSCIRKQDTERHHIYLTQYQRAGDMCELHSHGRWHLMQCRKGRLRVVMWPHGQRGMSITREMDFLDSVEVPLGWWHQVTAMEDDCYTACVFDLYDEEGRKLEDPKAAFDPKTEIAG